ncbi:hypothetical protein STIAU_0673, partial [Stigmatella aurantiaca DW4/3-1]
TVRAHQRHMCGVLRAARIREEEVTVKEIGRISR